MGTAMKQFLLDWSAVAPALASAFAFAALVSAWIGTWLAVKQLRANRNNQRETTSKNIWRDYLKLTIEYPQFTRGGFNNLTGRERERYKWFVANFLWGVEEILSFVNEDSVWRHNLLIQARNHRGYLMDATFRREDIHGYSPALRDFVEEATGRRARRPRDRRT